MQTGSSLIRVVPNADGGWDVREPGSARALVQVGDKDVAVRRARSMMAYGGVLQVLDDEGFLVEAQTVPSPAERPRWYLPPRTRVLVGLLLLQAAFGIVNSQDGGFGLGLYLTELLVGGFGVILAVRSYRRDRRLSRLPD